MEKEKAFPTIERYSFAEKCIHPLPSPPPHRKMQLMRRFAGMKSRRKTEGGVRTVNRGPNLYLRWYYFSKRRDGNKGGVARGKKKVLLSRNSMQFPPPSADCFVVRQFFDFFPLPRSSFSLDRLFSRLLLRLKCN